jgi:hypothetical protein
MGVVVDAKEQPMVRIEEYTKTDSKFSSMRLTFIWVVKFWLISTAVIILSLIGCSIANAIFNFEKPIALPVGPLVGLVATVGGVAFGGKSVQAFAEKDDTTPIDQTSK